MGVQNAQTMIFDDLHRLYSKKTPQPTIVRFIRSYDRQSVWNARRMLKDTPYILNEDFPEDIKVARSKLFPALKATRAAGLKSTMVYNKIRVEGKLYGVDQLHLLPKQCDLSLGCVKQNDDVVCFLAETPH